MKSILQDKDECWVCHTTRGLHTHHVFEGGTNGNRKMSEKFGLTVRLCGYHHNMSNEGVHSNKELELTLKRMAQEKFEETHTREEFRQYFNKSWL